MIKKILSAFLIVAFLATSIYFMMPDAVKIEIGRTNTEYSVWENESWVSAAVEYVNLYDGTTKMRAKSRELIYWEDLNYAYVSRTSIWKDNITTNQTYTFNKTADNVEQLPARNEFECFNCVGKIVHYEIRNILYEGETKVINSPFSFGHRMKIEWEDGAYYSKVFQQISSDKIIVKYRPTSDYESYEVRLFDPPGDWLESYNVNLIRYFNYNETGGAIIDLTNHVNGTNSGAVNNATGIIENAYNYSGTAQVTNYGRITEIEGVNANYSIRFWIRHDAVTGGSKVIFFNDADNSGGPEDVGMYWSGTNVMFISGGGAGDITTGITDLNDLAWHQIVVVKNAANFTIWEDGVLNTSVAEDGGLFGVGFTFRIADDLNIDYGDFILDEFALSNESWSGERVLADYNSGAGITYTDSFDNRIATATLSSPKNNINITDPTPDLSANFTGNDFNNISSVKVLVYDSSNNLDYTDTDGSPTSNDFKETWTTTALTDDTYNWSTFMYGDGGLNASTGNRSFLLDTTEPVVNIVFPQNINYFVNITELNYTVSPAQSCWWSNSSGIWNSTDVVAGINFTGITSVESSNDWSVYCNDSFNNIGSDSVIFIKDTSIPIINFTNPTTYSSSCGNTEILINVTANDSSTWINNITIYLYNRTSLVNTSTLINASGETFGAVSHFANFTNLPDGNYRFNASTTDAANSTNKTETVSGIIIGCLNSTVGGFARNTTAELGGLDIEINGSLFEVDICADIDHPDYGINFICGLSNVSFDLIINNFRKNIFNDSNTSFELNYSGDMTKYLFFPAHQYDEIDNMSFNISGIYDGGFPENVAINKSNTTDIDRIFPGYLFDDEIYLNKTIGGDGNISLFYNNPGEILVNFYMDDNADLNHFIFTAGGIRTGYDFLDNFDNFSLIDKSQTTAQLDKSGFILTANDTLAERVFDTFDDDSISSQWVYTNGSGSSGAAAWSQTASESLDNLRMLNTISNPSNDVTGTLTMDLSPDDDNLVLYVSESIEIDLTSKYDSEADNTGCSGNTFLYLGDSKLWTNYYEVDGDTGSNQVETSLANVTFNMTKNNRTNWEVNISGYETSTKFETVGGGGCGTTTGLYNWTNASYYITKSDCADVSGTLNNHFFLDVDYATTSAFKLSNSITLSTNDCLTNTIDTHIYNVNETLWNRVNSTVISEDVYASAGDLDSATLTLRGASASEEDFYLYLSADGGVNWENVANSVEHTFSDTGTSLRWRVDFVLNNSGYANVTSVITSINITLPVGWPSNLSFDFGNDGIIDFNFTGELNSTNSPITINVSTADLTSALNASPILYDHLISVPLSITSDSIGELNLSNFNLSYAPNPISLNVSTIANLLIDSIGFVDFPISVESTNGNITFDDVKYDYAGGNKTYTVLIHDLLYSRNITRKILFHYSAWNYEWIPFNVEWIYFAPKNSTAKNVQPYGQSSTTPLLNITNYGYGGQNATLSIYQNGTESCVNTTLSITSNKTEGIILNESFINLTSLSYLDTVNISLYADYDCNSSTWTLFEPQYNFRECVDGADFCSTEVL